MLGDAHLPAQQRRDTRGPHTDPLLSIPLPRPGCHVPSKPLSRERKSPWDTPWDPNRPHPWGIHNQSTHRHMAPLGHLVPTRWGLGTWDAPVGMGSFVPPHDGDIPEAQINGAGTPRPWSWRSYYGAKVLHTPKRLKIARRKEINYRAQPGPQSLTKYEQRLCPPPLGFHGGFYPRSL